MRKVAFSLVAKSLRQFSDSSWTAANLSMTDQYEVCRIVNRASLQREIVRSVHLLQCPKILQHNLIVITSAIFDLLNPNLDKFIHF